MRIIIYLAHFLILVDTYTESTANSDRRETKFVGFSLFIRSSEKVLTLSVNEILHFYDENVLCLY